MIRNALRFRRHIATVAAVSYVSLFMTPAAHASAITAIPAAPPMPTDTPSRAYTGGGSSISGVTKVGCSWGVRGPDDAQAASSTSGTTPKRFMFRSLREGGCGRRRPQS